MGIEYGEDPLKKLERERSPYNLLFDLAKALRESNSILPNIAIRQTYLNWADQLLNHAAIVSRPAPLKESLERPLFEVFCEQLEDLGAPVSREDRDSIFSRIMGD